MDYQRSAIDALRTRVRYLVSAAAIATSFLGGFALEDGAGVGGWVAIRLFVAFGAVGAKILWPRAEGAEGFTAKPSVLIETIDSADESKIGTIYRDLALYAEEAHDLNNDRHVKPLTIGSALRSCYSWLRFRPGSSTSASAKMRADMAKRPQPILLPNPMRPFPGDPAPQSQSK